MSKNTTQTILYDFLLHFHLVFNNFQTLNPREKQKFIDLFSSLVELETDGNRQWCLICIKWSFEEQLIPKIETRIELELIG